MIIVYLILKAQRISFNRRIRGPAKGLQNKVGSQQFSKYFKICETIKNRYLILYELILKLYSICCSEKYELF